MSDVNRNLAFDLGQIQQCGGVKSVNRIPTLFYVKDIKENS
jgi:hypothetical protein